MTSSRTLLAQGDAGPRSPPLRPVDLSLPEPVLRQVPPGLKEILLFKSVNRVKIISSPGPGHSLLAVTGDQIADGILSNDLRGMKTEYFMFTSQENKLWILRLNLIFVSRLKFVIRYLLRKFKCILWSLYPKGPV